MVLGAPAASSRCAEGTEEEVERDAVRQAAGREPVQRRPATTQSAQPLPSYRVAQRRTGEGSEEVVGHCAERTAQCPITCSEQLLQLVVGPPSSTSSWALARMPVMLGG